MKILVIEDEKLLADSIQTLLENKGFEVETAYDGETGKEYAVSAVYANGESRAVKAVEGTGIGSNHSMAPAVTAGKGVISINGMSGQNYNITSTSGITVASGEGKNHIDIPVSQGVYIVSISGNATKVIVK